MEIPSRHLRRRKKIQPGEFLDEQEQESLIDKYTSQANAQAQFYRVVFAVVLVLPSPAFIFARHCRQQPKLAFLSLVALATSVYTVRSKAARVSLLQKLNLLLGGLVALQAWLKLRNEDITGADAIWLLPLIGAVTSVLLDRWFKQVQTELHRLVSARYELRGV